MQFDNWRKLDNLAGCAVFAHAIPTESLLHRDLSAVTIGNQNTRAMHNHKSESDHIKNKGKEQETSCICFASPLNWTSDLWTAPRASSRECAPPTTAAPCASCRRQNRAHQCRDFQTWRDRNCNCATPAMFRHKVPKIFRVEMGILMLNRVCGMHE